MATPSLSDLARTITQSAEVIDGFLTSSDLPRLSTDVGGSPNSPVDPGNAEIQKARFAAIEASKVISELLVGADYHMFNTMGSVRCLCCLYSVVRS